MGCFELFPVMQNECGMSGLSSVLPALFLSSVPMDVATILISMM